MRKLKTAERTLQERTADIEERYLTVLETNAEKSREAEKEEMAAQERLDRAVFTADGSLRTSRERTADIEERYLTVLETNADDLREAEKEVMAAQECLDRAVFTADGSLRTLEERTAIICTDLYFESMAVASADSRLYVVRAEYADLCSEHMSSCESNAALKIENERLLRSRVSAQKDHDKLCREKDNLEIWESEISAEIKNCEAEVEEKRAYLTKLHKDISHIKEANLVLSNYSSNLNDSSHTPPNCSLSPKDLIKECYQYLFELKGNILVAEREYVSVCALRNVEEDNVVKSRLNYLENAVEEAKYIVRGMESKCQMFNTKLNKSTLDLDTVKKSIMKEEEKRAALSISKRAQQQDGIENAIRSIQA
jgi:hypothetical protein